MHCIHAWSVVIRSCTDGTITGEHDWNERINSNTPAPVRRRVEIVPCFLYKSYKLSQHFQNSYKSTSQEISADICDYACTHSVAYVRYAAYAPAELATGYHVRKERQAVTRLLTQSWNGLCFPEFIVSLLRLAFCSRGTARQLPFTDDQLVDSLLHVERLRAFRLVPLRHDQYRSQRKFDKRYKTSESWLG